MSAKTYGKMKRVATVHKTAPVYLNVIESRGILVLATTKIAHESPQVIVLQHGQFIWQAAHTDITAAEMENATVNF